MLLCGGKRWALRYLTQMARASSVKACGIRCPRIDVGGKFVMTAVEILDEGVASADHSGPLRNRNRSRHKHPALWRGAVSCRHGRVSWV